jgi:hypothetical protein
MPESTSLLKYCKVQSSATTRTHRFSHWNTALSENEEFSDALGWLKATLAEKST